MSLLTEAFETFTVMDKTTVDDGYGGITSEWKEGIDIQGAMPMSYSNIHKIADAVAEKATYVLTVRKNVSLDLYTVLKRKRDGAYFRLTSGVGDKHTPNSAGLNMRQYDVESFVLPGGNNG